MTAVMSSWLAALAGPSTTHTYLQQIWTAFATPFASIRTIMDALRSLPLLSFLLIPTMSSYSTSLNLLFFYLTWSTLVVSNPPLKVEIIGTLAVRILFHLLPSLFFYIFDAALPSAAVALKAQGEAGLPSRDGVRRKELKVLGWSFLNLMTSVLVQWVVELTFTRVLKIRSALKVTTTLPMPWSIAKDLLRGWLAREVHGLHQAASCNVCLTFTSRLFNMSCIVMFSTTSVLRLPNFTRSGTILSRPLIQ